MKIMNRFAKNLIAGAIAITMVAMAAQAFADSIPQYITILKVDGGARYSTDGGKNWVLLKRGDVLNPGSLIQTAEHGRVELLRGPEMHLGAAGAGPASTSAPSKLAARDAGGKGNAVRIYENSVLSVDKLTYEKTGMDEVSETQLDLKAGRIMGNVKKLSAASRYEVKIPNGVAGIRGTTYVIGADGVIYVIDGSIVISYVDPNGVLQTQTLIGGQSFNPSLPPGQQVGHDAPPVDVSPIGGIYVAPTNPTIDHTVYHISPN